MNYVVVHNLKGRAGVSIKKDGDMLNGEFTAWAIRSGKQVQYAYSRMAGTLKASYMLGEFRHMARYDLSYEEMIAVIRDHMGPSDKERFEDAIKVADQTVSSDHMATEVAMTVATGLGGVFWSIFKGGLKFLLWMVITPFIIMFISKPK